MDKTIFRRIEGEYMLYKVMCKNQNILNKKLKDKKFEKVFLGLPIIF